MPTTLKPRNYVLLEHHTFVLRARQARWYPVRLPRAGVIHSSTTEGQSQVQAPTTVQEPDVAPETVQDTVVAVAVDDTSDSLEALRWVLDNISFTGEKVHLVHAAVNDSPTVQAVGLSATGTRLALSTWDDEIGTAQQQEHMQRVYVRGLDMVNARFGSLVGDRPHKVVVELQDGGKNAASIGDIVCRRAQACNARLLAIASHGVGLQAEYGSVARFCMQHCKAPLLLLPPNMQSLHGGNDGRCIVLAAHNLAELDTVVPWVCANVHHTGDAVHVLHASKADEDASALAAVRQRISQQLAQHDIHDVTFTEVHSESDDVDGMRDMSQRVCEAVEQLQARMTVMMNYAHAGDVYEMLLGSLATHCSRQLTRPLLLLPAQV